MSRYLKDLHRSFKLKLQRVFFKGGEKRQLQEQFDIHKLFLFTSFHAEQQQLEHIQSDDLAAQLIEQSKVLPFDQQRQVVHQHLNSQLAHIARSIHTCLEQNHDRRPAATALQHTWQQLQRQQQQDQQQHVSSRLGGLYSSSEDQQHSAGAAASGQQQQQLISQAKLSQLLQQQLGYSLTVRPSNIQHQDAGLGLFVEGEVPPGALIALFPGLIYSREVHRRLPGYPRIDVGNPYLTARYDGRIVDSLPWGRGWLADGSRESQVVTPRRLGVLGSLAAASDGPRQPVPDTVWVRATTGEAAALEMLEGRNPLALAHYANHPAPGSVPNTIIASFTVKPTGWQQQQQGTAGSSSGSSSSGSSSNSSEAGVQVDPWMRAYVPNINYTFKCSQKDLLTQEVACVGLVSVGSLPAGTEVLFNYRLSPSLLGRPSWYVPVDSREENMRWA